jgi:hypothetical protein
MRVCDICRGPMINTWRTAVATIIVERFPGVSIGNLEMPRYQSGDACISCITKLGLVDFLPKENKGE